MIVQPDGKILAGGYFFSYNQEKRSHLIRLYGSVLDAPKNLSATVTSVNDIDLSWDTTPGAVNYIIERSMADNQQFSSIHSLPANNFTDTDLNPGTRYFYRVVAVNGNGNSVPSSTADATLRKEQTIEFNPIGIRQTDEESFTLTATASSGLTVTYSSSDMTVATIDGTTVTLISTGSTIIAAKQEGNDTFLPAPEISQELIVNAVTGVETKTKDNLNWYPNPGTGLFTIQFDEEREPVQAKVYTLSGQFIHSHQEVTSNKLAVDLNGLPQGIYIIELVLKNKTRHFKLIKE